MKKLYTFSLLLAINNLYATNDLESGRGEIIKQVREEVRRGLELGFCRDRKAENDAIEKYLEQAIPFNHPLANKNCWFREQRINKEKDEINWKFRPGIMKRHQRKKLQGIATGVLMMFVNYAVEPPTNICAMAAILLCSAMAAVGDDKEVGNDY